METLEKQPCPMCMQRAMTLTEDTKEIPYFGKVYLFSMTCLNCKYHKADIECAENKEPSRFTVEIDSEKDLNIRIVRSSHCTVKIPHLMAIEAGESANGYITNVEGILNRMQYALEIAKEDAEDDEDKKKIKNLMKKIINIKWGKEKVKLIIEDPTGNSAIISEKAVKEKLKVK
jgi:zinc finger protein